MAGGQEAVFAKEGVEDNYEEGARSLGRLRLSNKDVVVGVSASGMTPFVRARRPDPGAARRCAHHLRHLLAGIGAAELRRSADCAGSRSGNHRRVDAAQGRHGDQDGPEHADHDLDDQGRQDLRQPDGRRPDGIEKLKDRAPHPRIVTGLDYDAADALLRQAKWNVKAAIVMQKASLTLPQALKRLKKADDVIRDAIGEDIEPRLRQLLELKPAAP